MNELPKMVYCPSLDFECVDDVGCEFCNDSISNLLEFDSLHMPAAEIAAKTSSKALHILGVIPRGLPFYYLSGSIRPWW